jgi:hypothetical protein
MRPRTTLTFAAIALGGMLAAIPAFAQAPTGRSMNDGGMSADPNDNQQGAGAAPSYTGAQNDPGGNANCAARFHSYDPRTGTYLGRDGQRHLCQ